MDKKLNRTIGYIKTREDSYQGKREVIVPKEAPSEPELPKEVKQVTKIIVVSNEDRMAKIAQWLKEHDKFKVAPMCKEVGINQSNFLKLLKQPIPTASNDLLNKIETILKSYGYE
jgi:ABC-type taurine transport system substrate-binding protein